MNVSIMPDAVNIWVVKAVKMKSDYKFKLHSDVNRIRLLLLLGLLVLLSVSTGPITVMEGPLAPLLTAWAVANRPVVSSRHRSAAKRNLYTV